jgi:uncharacterized protein
MTVELRPLGVQCNLQCHYCYQHPQRDAGLPARAYDMERMKAGLLAEGRPFNLFGGEPLLVPKEDLEEIWKWGLEHFGRNKVQTNATLIDDDHIRLFRDYRVHVGVSIDGPGPLNDARWFGTLARTRAATAKTEAALARLCAEGLRPSIILTLHRGNASGPNLSALASWVTHMVTAGVRNWRLHLLETEDDRIRDKYAMDTAENVTALSEFLALTRRVPGLRMVMFDDMRRMLRGQDGGATCTWRGCDPYSTQAVHGVEGNGQRSNCGRTNKDGIDFIPAPEHGFERYLALHETPDAAGGCQGCRFFLMCKGQCPGTARDRDWRNKSEHCGVWKAMYGRLEDEMVAQGQLPLSLDPARQQIETAMLRAWRAGTNVTIAQLRARLDRQPASGGPESVRLHAGPALPPFLRVAWVSESARAAWEPRLSALAAKVSTLEWLTVAEGARPAAVVAVSGADRATSEAAWAERGLAGLELTARRARRAAPSSALASVLPAAVPAAAALRGAAVFAVGSRESAAAVRAAWTAGDDESLGAALGYPECCVLALGGATSGAWLMATPAAPAAGPAAPAAGPAAPAAGPAALNPLWWELGLAAIPHWACHPGCQPSVAIGDTFRAVAEAVGLADDWRLLHEVLSWPAEWTALHGIAELKTPVLKAATATEVSHELWRAAWAGTGYPAQGPAGVRFPYRAPRHLPLTSRSSFRAGLRRPFPVLQVNGGEMTPQPLDHHPAPEAPPAAPASDAASGPARLLTNDLARCFARDGFVRIPRVVPEAQVAAAASITRRLWTESGSRSGWSSIRPAPPDASALGSLLLGGNTARLIREFLPARYRVSPQLAVTAGTAGSPAGPHLDGPLDGHGTGIPSTFSLLVAVLLTDQQEADAGNLWAWPGTHLLAAEYFRAHGSSALPTTDRYPDVRLDGCDPVQVRGSVGDVVVASYLLGHAAGHSTAGAWRATAYFRLRTPGLASRWQESVLDPFAEFSPIILEAAASVLTEEDR